MQEIHITEREAGQRLDKLLAKFFRAAPRSFLYKMLRKKNITLNGKKVSGQEKLAEGDVVTCFLSQETIEKFSGTGETSVMPALHHSEYPLEILYEDTHILLLNKPAGMLSQKAKDTDISAVEYLTDYLLASGQLTRSDLQIFRPSVCNRLDRNTSGILSAGKSLAGLQELSRFFKERTLAKYYLCLVKGQVEESALICGYLKKDSRSNRVQVSRESPGEGTRIETAYRPLAYREDVTLLEVHLITGKTHQIRAHLASMGHPIIGDYKYGNRNINEEYKKQYGLQSQLLHAWKIRMPESDGPLEYLSGKEFAAPPPGIFQKICTEKQLYKKEKKWKYGDMEFPRTERIYAGGFGQSHK